MNISRSDLEVKIGRAFRLASTLLVLLAMVCGTSARAHEIPAAVLDLSFSDDGDTLLGTLEFNAEAFLVDLGGDVSNSNDSPKSAEYDALRALEEASLSLSFEERLAEFAELFVLRAGGVDVPVAVSSFYTQPVGDTEIARISVVDLRAALPDGAQTIQIGWSPNMIDLIVRTAEEGGEGYAELLQDGELSQEIAIFGPTDIGFWATLIDYISTGFEHIVPLGLDHILFVVGLFLLSTAMRPLLWQITAFTLAHSVTLALGMLGILNLPGEIVEPIIAASIVYVAVENILSPTMTKWRPIIVFAFGLLHGLGFAGVLSEFGMPSSQFVAALIGFNIGVEFGQLAVILVCFLLVGYWFGKKPWYRKVVVIPGSLVVAAIGLYWVLERTILAA